jgi:uncharacterized protein (DUF983 family)
MRLSEKMEKWETINDVRCPRCANPWWFNKPELQLMECTTCQIEISTKRGKQDGSPIPIETESRDHRGI